MKIMDYTRLHSEAGRSRDYKWYPLSFSVVPGSRLWIVGFVLLFVVAGCKIATIRPLDPETGKAILIDARKDFDPVSYVEDIWDTLIMPAVSDEAVSLAVLLDALEEDRDGACARYGHHEGTRPCNYIVKGNGKIANVDTTSRAGLLYVDVDLSEIVLNVRLQMGPVIRGTALRDVMPFIQFNQFTNQLDYADISKEMHRRLNESVLSSVRGSFVIEGAVTFSGACALRDIDDILITPVILEIGG